MRVSMLPSGHTFGVLIKEFSVFLESLNPLAEQLITLVELVILEEFAGAGAQNGESLGEPARLEPPVC